MGTVSGLEIGPEEPGIGRELRTVTDPQRSSDWKQSAVLVWVVALASLRFVAELSQGTQSAAKYHPERDLFLLSFGRACTIFQRPLF